MTAKQYKVFKVRVSKDSLERVKVVLLEHVKKLEQRIAEAQKENNSEPVGTIAHTVHGTPYVKWRKNAQLISGTNLFTSSMPDQSEQTLALAVALEALAWCSGHMPNEPMIERAIKQVMKALVNKEKL